MFQGIAVILSSSSSFILCVCMLMCNHPRKFSTVDQAHCAIYKINGKLARNLTENTGKTLHAEMAKDCRLYLLLVYMLCAYSIVKMSHQVCLFECCFTCAFSSIIHLLMLCIC